ncbi:MAG TPA: DUF1634 domain-containing protein [Chthoniobacter sp.]|jgi:uncharacterized membrane protein
MKTKEPVISHLESRLAALLHVGTWLACGLIALGLPLFFILDRKDQHPQFSLAHLADPLMKAGIAVFILLPVLRVIVMLVLFRRQKDYRFAAIAALVLAIILVSVLVGVISSRTAG